MSRFVDGLSCASSVFPPGSPISLPLENRHQNVSCDPWSDVDRMVTA